MLNITGLDNSSIDEIKAHIEMLTNVIKERERKFKIKITDSTSMHVYKIYDGLYYFVNMGIDMVVPMSFTKLNSKLCKPIKVTIIDNCDCIDKVDLYGNNGDYIKYVKSIEICAISDVMSQFI